MEVHVINPLSDSRWNDLVERHPQASVFHHRGWLQALARTYGYEPSVLTSSAPGQPLQDGMVFCRISSWITGTRFVSLPFADHCDLLSNQPGASHEFGRWLQTECERQKCSYVELRPRMQAEYPGFQSKEPFWFHELDLSPSTEQLFDNLHKDSIQRKIRRAGREGLVCDSGRSPHHVREFYRLLLLTRRRHQLFPQPRNWFHNLIAGMGDKIEIRLARKNNKTVAAMLALRHRSSVIYKYGCSDENLHNLGGMPFLFWRLIEESKAAGAQEIDFGRSDADNPGLVTFKDRFGTTRRQLTYQRYSTVQEAKKPGLVNSPRLRRLIPILPDTMLAVGGRILYRHMG